MIRVHARTCARAGPYESQGGRRDRERAARKREKREEKGPDSASKRLDSEPKRNKLLHKLVAVDLLLFLFTLSLRTNATPPLTVECAGRPPGTKIHI